jgi:hypothetical protein
MVEGCCEHGYERLNSSVFYGRLFMRISPYTLRVIVPNTDVLRAQDRTLFDIVPQWEF